jgi:hypothetical protein
MIEKYNLIFGAIAIILIGYSLFQKTKLLIQKRSEGISFSKRTYFELMIFYIMWLIFAVWIFYKLFIH